MFEFAGEDKDDEGKPKEDKFVPTPPPLVKRALRPSTPVNNAKSEDPDKVEDQDQQKPGSLIERVPGQMQNKASNS